MLEALLIEEIEATRELIELLDRECTALRSFSREDLEQTMALKQDCTERLQGLVASRIRYLERNGFPADADGIGACIRSFGTEDGTRLQDRWGELARLALVARHQNETNGAIIAAGRRQIERALAILHGLDPRTGLYDRGAQTDFGSGSQPLAEA